MEGVRAGKGTIGALMVDPSVYEDVKLLLGNVERNKALRALVRWSADRRLLWIFAYRALNEAELAALPEASVIQRIRVQCLDSTAAAILTRAIAPSSAIDHHELFDVVGGHPLLLQTLVRTGGELPPDLEWLVDDWIARLPAETLRALRKSQKVCTVEPLPKSEFSTPK